MGKLIKTLETGAKIYGASYLISKGISKGIGKKTPKDEAEAEILKKEHEREHERVICESCGRKKHAQDMSGLCVICHKHICNKCEYECDECKKIFCDEHIAYKKKTFFSHIAYCKKCIKLPKVKQKIEKMEGNIEHSIRFRGEWVLIIIGILLSITVIGAIIGIPMIIIGILKLREK